MSSTVTIKFKNRRQSIAFFKTFGCKNIVAALEAAEEREKSAQQSGSSRPVDAVKENEDHSPAA